MQKGSEQVCDDKLGEISELVTEEIEFDVITLAWEDTVD